MGSATSSGESNEELVDNLVEAHYIKSAEVERVFRAVDRGHFFPPGGNDDNIAYRDSAWKSDHIHLSSPCIYCEVMEYLELRPGLTFLNIGSGTGYLSTLAGLQLGANSVNHGIEIFDDVVQFANSCVSEFARNKTAFDEFEFCMPEFVCGNGLMLPSGTQYDRIYCGAACSQGSQLRYLKTLVKADGILITPVNNELMMYKRTGEDEWEEKSLLPVSFALLLPAIDPFLQHPVMPRHNPIQLDEACRVKVREVIRRKISEEHPELLESSAKSRKSTRTKRKYEEDSDLEEGCSFGTIDSVATRVKVDSGVADIDYSDVDSNIDYDSDSTFSSGSDLDEKVTESDVPKPTFAHYMKEKIDALPLPKPVLIYLNLGRPL